MYIILYPPKSRYIKFNTQIFINKNYNNIIEWLYVLNKNTIMTNF